MFTNDISRKYFISANDYNKVGIVSVIRNIHEDLNNDIDTDRYPLFDWNKEGKLEGCFVAFDELDYNDELCCEYGGWITLEPDCRGSYLAFDCPEGLDRKEYNRDNVKIIMKNLFKELRRDGLGEKPIVIEVSYGRFHRY